ncbi:MAG: sigma-70 family RNA polymerase sigma factor [Duncaniella sp.]|nr:sigma-70 family RNA polymerase sigma factor [Duncaniella sp.]HBI58676.1 sigma-70 family RNA polymerase sigma factor [Porphyromonadaceae bacterium]
MEQKDFEAMAPQLRQRIVGMVRKLSADSGDTDLADDVAQDTLLKLWSMRDRLDAYTSVEALAMVIARNRAIDLLKRVSALRSCDIADIDISDTAVSAEDAIISTESENRAMSLLASLPSGQQAVLRMRHVDGMEISEIAAVTGSTTNAIRVTLSRARQNIKELYLKTTEKI